MRKHFVFGIILAALVTAVVAQPQGRPIPPGVREADAQTNKPMEAPPPAKSRTVDTAQLQREAGELAKLSAGIPDQVSFVAKGKLPKNLGDQLKRIEKLAKHLRSEISD